MLLWIYFLLFTFENKKIYSCGNQTFDFLFAVFYPDLHIIFNFALDQATACPRRLICLAFRRFGFKPV